VNTRVVGHSRILKVYTDGAIRSDQGASGLGAIVRDERNQICFWWQHRAGAMTNNEAEYAAVIFAFECLKRTVKTGQIVEIAVFSDSRVVVDQMNGKAEAHAPGLQRARTRLRVLIESFPHVTFHHIAREQNRLADALAFEAVCGPPCESHAKMRAPNRKLWEQLEATWRTK